MRTDIYAPKKSPELVAQVRKLRDEGVSYNKIGQKLGISPMTARAWLDAKQAQRQREKNGHGVQTHKGNSRTAPKPEPAPAAASNVDPHVQYRAIELRRRGFSKQAIAAQLRVPYRQVEEALR